MTTAYEQLQTAIRQLRTALLPGDFTPSGDYPDPEATHLRTISFRILAHAELEAYFEDLANLLFHEGWSAWDRSGVPSRVIIGLLAFSGREHSLPSSSSTAKKAETNSIPCTEKAKNKWWHNHRNNHGIKEENLLKLLLPLGISAEDLDSTLISDLSSYGSSRGEAAHRSNLKVKTLADPKTEFDIVTQLVCDIKKIDDLVNAAIEEIRMIRTAFSA
ncbi:hypothetical protein D3C86_1044000 [compost metagenome]